MRVIVAKKEFNRALNLLNKATDKKSVLLPYRHIKLRTIDSYIEFQGTNGEVFLTLQVPAEVEKEGEVVVEAGVFLKIIQSSKVPSVKLYTEEDKLIIDTEHVIQKLPLKPSNEFLQFPQPQFEASLPAIVLREAIEKTSFAIATEKEDSMEVLKYLFIDGRENFTNFVGSNGHQLALARSNELTLNVKAKLYIKSLKLLKDLLKNTEQMQIGFDESFVHLSGGWWVMFIRDCSETNYPDYEAVFPNPTDYDVMVVVRAEDLDEVLANFVKHPKITIEFTNKDDGFKIKAFDHFDEEIECWVKADVYGDKQFSIDFNPKQLKEFTEVVEKEVYIVARFKDDDNIPALFEVNENYFYLVMPIIRKKSY